MESTITTQAVRVAEDSDFESLRQLLDCDVDWKFECGNQNSAGTNNVEQLGAQVWTRATTLCDFRMVRVRASFDDVTPEDMYDVLHDPEYRKHWDEHAIACEDIGYLNVNNDVGYYAMSCPAPLKNRDFVLQRSWLDTGTEQMILNRSVLHKNYPPRKGFIRATSHITGYLIRSKPPHGCTLGYVSHSDPRGALPSWLVNRLTHSLAPRLLKSLHRAALNYAKWKQSQTRPLFKPWRDPECIEGPRLSLSDCMEPTDVQNVITKSEHKASTLSLPEIGKTKKKKRDKKYKTIVSDTE